jgi:hypothetical protein
MAATIYYDKNGFYDASVAAGTINSSNVFAASSSITNPEYISDEGIDNAMTNVANEDAVQLTFSTGVTNNFVALYFTSAMTETIALHYDNSSSGTAAVAVTITADFSAGWNVSEFTLPAPFQFWLIKAHGAVAGLSEALIGAKLALPLEPSATIITEHRFGSEQVKAYGANRYYIEKHNSYKILTVSFDHMTSANKTTMLSFSNTVTDRKPFIYSEDGTTGPFHWVRLVRPLTFRMVAPDIWSCQMVMKELIA